jgi:amino acid transporter
VFLTFSKIVGLLIIIGGGIARLFMGIIFKINLNINNLNLNFFNSKQGHYQHLLNAFEGTNTNILALASGFYGGTWAYDGWNNLNFVTEEIINPQRNLPLSIFLSVPLVTVVYLLVNISYFTAMSKEDLIQSEAFAIVIFFYLN